MRNMYAKFKENRKTWGGECENLNIYIKFFKATEDIF